MRVGNAAIAILLSLGAAQHQAAQATTDPIPEPPAFEVASIRAHAPNAMSIRKIGTLPGGRFSATGSLRHVIAYAYGLQPYQEVIGDHDVLDRWFDIQATLPPGTPPTNKPLRAVQALLSARFKLAVRVENRQQTIELLERLPGSVGSRLVPLARGCDRLARMETDLSDTTPPPRCSIGLINGRLTADVESVDDFAAYLSSFGRRAVVNATGLAGPFHLEMTFDPGTFLALVSPTPSALGYPSFADALRRDLGMKLVSERRDVAHIVVTHVEPPTEN